MERTNVSYFWQKMYLTIILFSAILSLQSCVSTLLIPDRMVKTELGSKLANTLNRDEDYLRRAFGTPTKVKAFEDGRKIIYYEEWGRWNTEKIGNTQYYTDYRFINFVLGPDGVVENYSVSDKSYVLEYDSNQTLKTIAFWIEIFAYGLVTAALTAN